MSNLIEILNASAQKKERPSIEKVCSYLITNPMLAKGMNEIFVMLEKAGAKISWYLTSKYKVKYKGDEVCRITIGDGFRFTPNWVRLESRGSEQIIDPAAAPVSEKDVDAMKALIADTIKVIDKKSEKHKAPSGKQLSKLEHYLAEMPEGEKKKSTIKFITWLKENKMTPQLFSPNSYKVSVKNQRLCYIRFPNAYDGDWHVQFVRGGYGNDGYGRGVYTEPLDFDSLIENAELTAFLLSGLKECRGCYECKPGMPIKIKGENYNMCIINFQNPNESSIDNLIKVIECWKNNILSQ